VLSSAAESPMVDIEDIPIFRPLGWDKYGVAVYDRTIIYEEEEYY
jgi:hypothetical protein